MNTSKSLTPWAVLLVRPVDDDPAVRKVFHAISRTQHPDHTQDRRPGPLWFAASEAYKALRTEALRTAWLTARSALAGICSTCSGLGVTWRRVGHDHGAKVCDRCCGTGRT
jgi:hypothetical protein